MKYLCNYTGGHMCMGDSFSTSLFKQSFIHVFDTDEQGALKLGYNAKIEIKVSSAMFIFWFVFIVLVYFIITFYLLNI